MIFILPVISLWVYADTVLFERFVIFISMSRWDYSVIQDITSVSVSVTTGPYWVQNLPQFLIGCCMLVLIGCFMLLPPTQCKQSRDWYPLSPCKTSEQCVYNWSAISHGIGLNKTSVNEGIFQYKYAWVALREVATCDSLA